MKPPVKKVVVYVVDFARNAIKMGRGAALRQILLIRTKVRSCIAAPTRCVPALPGGRLVTGACQGSSEGLCPI